MFKELKYSAENSNRIFEIFNNTENILENEYDINRIIQLLKADREGRCIILPCKPSGTTVYQIRKKKHACGEGISERHIHCATVWGDGSYELEHQGQTPCTNKDFNKTWFLDYEKAKKVLDNSRK